MDPTTIECPICMDDIDVTKNCTFTECGHCFHTSCLMRNCVHNGFGCPYCRTVMAEVPEEEEEEEDEEDEEDDDEEEQIRAMRAARVANLPEIENQMYRGFRIFYNRIEGDDTLQPDDNVEEDEYDEEIQDLEEGEIDYDSDGVPSASFVVERLTEQGVTFERVVDLLLRQNHVAYSFRRSIVVDFKNELADKLHDIVERHMADQPDPVVPAAPIANPFSAILESNT